MRPWSGNSAEDVVAWHRKIPFIGNFVDHLVPTAMMESVIVESHVPLVQVTVAPVLPLHPPQPIAAMGRVTVEKHAHPALQTAYVYLTPFVEMEPAMLERVVLPVRQIVVAVPLPLPFVEMEPVM